MNEELKKEINKLKEEYKYSDHNCNTYELNNLKDYFNTSIERRIEVYQNYLNEYKERVTFIKEYEEKEKIGKKDGLETIYYINSLDKIKELESNIKLIIITLYYKDIFAFLRAKLDV